jgi:hypothetical protein
LESHGFKMKVLFWSFLLKIIWKSFELNFKVALALQPMLGGYL